MRTTLKKKKKQQQEKDALTSLTLTSGILTLLFLHLWGYKFQEVEANYFHAVFHRKTTELPERSSNVHHPKGLSFASVYYY